MKLRSYLMLSYLVVMILPLLALYLIYTGFDWLQIRVNDAETGWIASWLTEKPASQEPNRTQTGHSNNLNGYTIVIDPGHGGRDPGGD